MRHEEVGRGTVEHDDLDLWVGFQLVNDLGQTFLDFGVVEVERRIVEGHPPLGESSTLSADRLTVFAHDVSLLAAGLITGI
jgi:hypothetical protein